MSKGVKVLLLAACSVVVLAGLKLAAPVVVPFLLASFLALVSAPLVLWMTQQGVPRLAAVGSAFLGNVTLVALTGKLVLESTTALYLRLPRYKHQFETLLNETAALAARGGVDVAPQQLFELVDFSEVVGVVGSTLRGVFGTLVTLFLVLLIVVFMLLEAAGLRDKLRSILDTSAATELSSVAKTASEVQKYLVVKTLASLGTGVLVGVWVALLDVELPWLMGALAFALNFIPTLGSIIAAVPAVLLALLNGGPGTAAMVATGYVAVNISIGNFVEPRILGRALGLSPLVVLLSVVFWGWLLGPIGALLSVPLTNVLRIFLVNTDDLRWLAVLLGPSLAPHEQPEPSPPRRG